MKSFWEKIGESIRTDAAKIQADHLKLVNESKEKEEKAAQSRLQENARRWIFGKKSYNSFRGQNIIPEIKYFYYMTPRIIITPCLYLTDCVEEAKF